MTSPTWPDAAREQLERGIDDDRREKVINLQERFAERDTDRPVLVGSFADFLDEKAKRAWWPDDATYRQAAREIRRLESIAKSGKSSAPPSWREGPMFDTLCLWLLHCNRQGKDGIIVPLAHLEKAIRDAAKAEGREHERYPFETGAEHETRTKHTT